VILGAKKIEDKVKKDIFTRDLMKDLGEVDMMAAETYFNGNCLTPNEQKRVFNATCMTSFEDIMSRFGN